MQDRKQLFEIVMECARIPSFSSYEDAIHTFIENFIRDNSITATIERVPANNLIISTPGNPKCAPVALSAHLDKINHYGTHKAVLEVCETVTKLIGQLDDAVGVGICLFMLLQSKTANFPPLMVLFSEMEESYGLRNHRHLLKNNGQGLYPRIGSERIALHLLQANRLPALVLTIDTSPLLRGRGGLVLYAKHWERNSKVCPSATQIEATSSIVKLLHHINPNIRLANNTNDYVKYGELFNAHDVPCLALEPSIYPYHRIAEEVFKQDIEQTAKMLRVFLTEYLLTKCEHANPKI